ncbi:hypothetical protein LNQ81_02355 [Myroides sp. M-43]|uniref:hypothetical protein n=1 Tax=Myroides oncorhynchi TaxID=2893756 RepID=UPI001E287290|nr:hypothetical protein [Myroides oncorhynchi]MCC9041559.1 hypothetical protein [Myroides oncorhynchi]
MKKIIYFALTILSLGLTTSCTSDDNAMDKGPSVNPGVTKPTIKVLEAKENNFQFTVYSNVKEFYAPSTTPIVVEINDLSDASNKSFTNTSMTITMYMTMENGHKMSHSAPISQLKPVAGTTNKFEGEIMFSMAGMEPGANYWEIKVESTNKNNKINTTFKTTVRGGKFYDRQDINTIVNSDRKTLETFSLNAVKHYTALHPMYDPKTGLNNIAVSIYRNEKMGNEFPEVENLIVTIDPRMPDMGNHGVKEGIISLNYNATTKQYEGKLPFSMSGYWFLNLVIKNQAGEIIAGQNVSKDAYGKETVNGDKFFDIVF